VTVVDLPRRAHVEVDLRTVPATIAPPATRATAATPGWVVRHWPWVLAGAFFALYVVAGLWLAFGIDYAIGDALSRAESARSIAHSRDQHLMGVGVYWMPWPAFAEVPFMAVFSRLGIVELAWIVPTALAGALTIPQLADIGRTLGIGARWTAGLIVAFALNPYTVFFSANGMSEAWLVLFATGMFAAYLRWVTHRRTRDLGLVGLWLAMAQFARYEAIVLTLTMAVCVAWQAVPKRRVATAIVTALPATFVLLVWTVTCFVIIDRGWWEVVAEANPTEPIEVLDGGPTIPRAVEFAATLALRVAPGIALLILLVVPRELVGQLRRAGRRPLLATPVAAVAATFPAQQVVLLMGEDTFGDPRYWSPLAVMSAIIGLVVLGTVRGRAKPLIGALVVACAVASAASSLQLMGDREASYVTGEWAVIERLFGKDLERTGNDTLDELDLDTYREFSRAVDDLMGPDDILVLDSAKSHPYHLFSGRPKQIATDRDKDSERLLARAETRFTFAMLKLGTSTATTTPQSLAIRELVQQVNNRGRWERVEGRVGDLGLRVGQEVYRFVPNPDAPPDPRRDELPGD
jgi:hypothetical protein